MATPTAFRKVTCNLFRLLRRSESNFSTCFNFLRKQKSNFLTFFNFQISSQSNFSSTFGSSGSIARSVCANSGRMNPMQSHVTNKCIHHHADAPTYNANTRSRHIHPNWQTLSFECMHRHTDAPTYNANTLPRQIFLSGTPYHLNVFITARMYLSTMRVHYYLCVVIAVMVDAQPMHRPTHT